MAKAPENIQAFQRMVGAILGQLYEIHPEELLWDGEEFFDDSALSDNDASTFDSTVKYLVRHGYLHQDPQDYLQLTPKSWEVLQQPDPMNADQTVGAALVSWSKDAGSEVSKGIIAKTAETVLAAVFRAAWTGATG